ncbi:NAD(P)H-hydrate dehydratase [Bacteroidales bacterium OttesenSCG-928-I21]|nr:NAD(P)H-hydrate dehydratase [Bacteroidales bacterium OttesenSCG-928-I21]
MNNKLFKSEQIKFIDNFTIKNESIESINLMERAATNILTCLSKEIDIFKRSFSIICGTGNNGGDGLALARLLCDMKIKTKVVLCNLSSNLSTDCKINLERFEKNYKGNLFIVTENNLSDIKIDDDDIIIDCLFGSGLSRPIKENYAKIVKLINDKNNYTISVDMPSGLFGEDNSTNDGEIVKADLTLTIQFPPISSMFVENYKYYGNVLTVPIGLSKEAISQTKTNWYVSDFEYVKSKIKNREKFDHKGIYGHALIISGSYGKAGAAVLCTRACIKSGAGLVTTHVPTKLVDILQISVPEAMINIDDNDKYFSSYINGINNFSAIGIGPGIGTNSETKEALINFLHNNNIPIVVDADAINILSETNNFKNLLKVGTILTPHPKEFERLFGKFENSYERLKFMQDFSESTGVIILLKGGISSISLPNRKIYFNTGGNPGMATAGSGDVLTGIITALLAQGYNPADATILGAFIHSAAGNFAKKECGLTTMTATDIINNLSSAFKELEI